MTLSDQSLLRRITIVLSLFSVLLALGTAGYVMIEGWSFADSLYMTIITVSTVGFSEVRAMSWSGRLFTSFLIIGGVGAAAYTFSTVADYIVAGELRGFLRRQRMANRIKRLHGHYIVCGFGRVGNQVVQELAESGVHLVVIDHDPDVLEYQGDERIITITGDAAADSHLIQAGIERAAGLCSCLPNDAANVFVTLTARTLNPDLTIIARANTAQNERKLRIAGADHVINPYTISGHRMARQLIHPNVVEFMDVVMRRGEVEIRIEEIRISEGSSIEGQSIADAHIRHRTGTNVLAVRRPGGRTFTNLTGDFLLNKGDTLLALGTPEQLENLVALAGDGIEELSGAD